MVPVDTTDPRALATASIDRTQGGVTADQDGTLVHIGGGVYLTAGHVLYQFVNPDRVRPADDYRITVAEGLAAEAAFTIPAAEFDTAFHNFGWGTDGGTDIAVVFGENVAAPAQSLLLNAGLDALVAPLVSFGYPAGGGFDGATMIEVSGTLQRGGYQMLDTPNGTVSVMVSEPGMEVLPGQSGSGVWYDYVEYGTIRTDTFLIGIATLDLTSEGGSPATGFEPLAEIYTDLAALIEERGLSADDFARQVVDLRAVQDQPSVSLTGTFFHEDMFGTFQSETLSAGGGNDLIAADWGEDVIFAGDGYDTVYGGAGGDTIHDGDGVDRLYGGATMVIFDVREPGGVFVMAADGRSDIIADFEDGDDLIDLSAWGVTGLADLSIEDHRSGRVIVRHEREALVIDDGARGLRASNLDADDFVFAASVAPIEGTEGRDLLIGTDADEVFRDLGGVDRMYGKGGADRFELSLDGATDQIKDFENGIDLIDISDWGVTTLDQMTVEQHSAGRVILRHGDEILMLTGQDAPLTPEQIDDTDFVFA